MMRLDKFISERTEYTRTQIRQLCAKGSVSVNGAVVKKSDTKINEDSDTVNVCGRELSASRFSYILLNKPKGYVSSTNDNDGESVLKLVPDDMRTKGMFPAGRLDKDSTGALLITETANWHTVYVHLIAIYPKFISLNFQGLLNRNMLKSSQRALFLQMARLVRRVK